MSNFSVNKKKNYLNCCNCCLGVLLTGIIGIVVTYQISVRIAESTIFLTTENILLIKTYDYISLRRDNDLQEELKTAYSNEFCNTTVIAAIHVPDTSITTFLVPNITDNGTFLKESDSIFLKESDDYFVFVETSKHTGVKIGIRDRFWKESCFSFYRIHKDTVGGKPQVVKTEFMGSIHTNLYGAWQGNSNEIFICCNGKYITMCARGVDSRSLGKFRNKEVLLVWEIGENVAEKDIVDRNGNKIPIIIKTDEEMERK